MDATATATDPLIAAWTRQMIADPKLAYEALTGFCEWDTSIPSSVIEEWSYDADEMAYDLKVANPGWACGRTPQLATRIRKLTAASDAFSAIAENYAREEKLARWRAEDAGCQRPSSYLPSEFV